MMPNLHLPDLSFVIALRDLVSRPLCAHTIVIRKQANCRFGYASC